MIDEKKLIAYLNDWMLQESYLRQMKDPADTILECIRAVESQPKIGEWIPVSERLPSEEDFVNAYLRNKYSAEFIVMIDGATRPTTLYFRKTGTWEDENGNLYKVIAWMPLPEPYMPKQPEWKENMMRKFLGKKE